ncbi:uncharacterized protein LOC121242328 [Juglans microcarpa x Juglans regia]|uniref:uncharacterized protein LOC121242328 n=1 Tax=Juglans microcarpa x Juglans regia TaxID=2249226 RepID=UPI001B7E6C05|nr:uncharacterized protein LOC121242328 [Juglans microcarpa x Juglans regia]
MYNKGGSRVHDELSTRGNLWESYRKAITRRKDFKGRVLWPNVFKDAKEFVKKVCPVPDSCTNPGCTSRGAAIHNVTMAIRQWGIDLVGPMPPSKGGTKFIIVAVDYFMKWAEAEAMVTITTQSVTKFLWKA